MVDYAKQDPRSVAAMLRGRGDGRERLWLKFEKAFSYIEPNKVILMAAYAHWVNDQRLTSMLVGEIVARITSWLKLSLGLMRLVG